MKLRCFKPPPPGCCHDHETVVGMGSLLCSGDRIPIQVVNLSTHRFFPVISGLETFFFIHQHYFVHFEPSQSLYGAKPRDTRE